jgi:ATP-binding cassette subfamily F protein 3
MVNKIVELYQQQLHIYNGNYDFFEKEKAIRIDLQQKAFENQQDFIRQQERFIERFKAKASKAAQAQSIQKKLDRLERIEDVAIERPNININFRMDKVPGKVISTLRSVGKSFGQNRIIENTSIEINRGDKIALIGANGKGKSTLLRIIGGTEPHSGERVEGHNVVESFYAQHQLEALDLQHTVLDELKGCGSQMTEQELRNLLGCFLFGGDDVEKKIRVLSGGEKARVALAKTIVSKANFLLLDEPTNHLDMHSVELLAEALQKYEGTYLFVSHDRYFIAKAANKIWEIENHRIKEFDGGYEEWVEWKKRMEMQRGSIAASEAPPVKTDPVTKPKAPAVSPQQNGIPKDVKKEWQRLQKRFQTVESQLADLQKEAAGLQESLASPEVYGDKEKFLAAEKKYQDNEKNQKMVSKEYEELFEKIMAIESKFPGGLD